jgi:hypothetical protein
MADAGLIGLIHCSISVLIHKSLSTINDGIINIQC